MAYIIRNNVKYAGGSGSGGNTNSVELTQAEYDELLEAGQVDSSITYFITDSDDNFTAEDILFNESESGLTGNSVQGAIESAAKLTSDKFDETKDYVVGDYCIYSNALYKFNKAKSAGAWDSTVVDLTNVGAALVSAKDELTNIESKVEFLNQKFITAARSVYVSPSGSDETGNGTTAKPYATINKAVSLAPSHMETASNFFTIYLLAGTYNENVSINGKNIRIYLYGDVIIKGTDTSAAVLAVRHGSYVTITGSSTTKYNLTLSTGATGITVNYKGTLLVTNINLLKIGTATSRAINVDNGHLSIGSSVESIEITNTCTLSNNVIASTNNSFCLVTPKSSSTISSASTCSGYAFSATYNSYLDIGNFTIPSTYAKGIQAQFLGRILVRSTVTNNATTKTSAINGGEITEL